MPDFEIIRLGAPVKAEFQFRGDVRCVEVDGHFEVVVPSVAKADTIVIATLEHDRKQLEYRLIEGRLFRPFFQYNMHLWTLDDLRDRKPPLVRGAPLRGINLHRETPLLGSPWLDWDLNADDATDATRARVQRLAPQAWEDVEKSLQAAAASGLRIVDSMLFQETRTPALGFEPRGSTIKPAMPDGRNVDFSVLIDPRLSTRDLSSIARRVDSRWDRNSLRILEPSLLPDTVASDAVAAFAIWVCKSASNFNVGNCDIDRMIDALQLFRGAEKAIAGGLALDECYAAIERWTAHCQADHRDLWGPGLASAQIADQAALFVELRERFPPLTADARPPEQDVEGIARAFRP